MEFQYNRHYTVEEARALLPQIRQWLSHLQQLRARMEEAHARLHPLLEQGNDVGGERVNSLLKSMTEFKAVFREFERREIQIKDLDRGLLDFPSIRQGREVFLCWEQDEEDIEFWHELDSGYAGRDPL